MISKGKELVSSIETVRQSLAIAESCKCSPLSSNCGTEVAQASSVVCGEGGRYRPVKVPKSALGI